jgi:hypothetical protein
VNEVNPKNQGSDYYLGLFVEDENKVYMLPVTSCYQFTQQIERFADVYNGLEDNEALK